LILKTRRDVRVVEGARLESGACPSPKPSRDAADASRAEAMTKKLFLK
jgi:hypothetical protein